MTNSVSILMSIHPHHAASIKSGKKTVELRRVKPKIKKGDLVVIYETAPISSITSMFSVKRIDWMPLDDLWKKVKSFACITKREFDDYFAGNENGCAITIDNMWEMSNPIFLNSICSDHSTIRPPQSYIYLSTDNISKIIQEMPI